MGVLRPALTESLPGQSHVKNDHVIADQYLDAKTRNPSAVLVQLTQLMDLTVSTTSWVS